MPPPDPIAKILEVIGVFSESTADSIAGALGYEGVGGGGGGGGNSGSKVETDRDSLCGGILRSRNSKKQSQPKATPKTRASAPPKPPGKNKRSPMEPSPSTGLTAYDLLEVSPVASPETITAAYRALARKYHPDATGNNAAAAETMKELNRARDLLLDPSKRKEYDRWLTR